jgi:hypothetical protein
VLYLGIILKRARLIQNRACTYSCGDASTTTGHTLDNCAVGRIKRPRGGVLADQNWTRSGTAQPRRADAKIPGSAIGLPLTRNLPTRRIVVWAVRLVVKNTGFGDRA